MYSLNQYTLTICVIWLNLVMSLMVIVHTRTDREIPEEEESTRDSSAFYDYFSDAPTEG